MNSTSRRLPRYSVRMMIGAMTLVCAYFGSWELTKTYGVRSSQHLLHEQETSGTPLPAAITPPFESSPMPFVVRRRDYGYFNATERYYLWFFGWSIKLPFEVDK